MGMKGSRVQSVVQELRGERIDIVPWHPDPARYVCSALSPAQVSKVIIDEEAKSMDVIVPDDQLSLAIGRRGQNVRPRGAVDEVEHRHQERIQDERDCGLAFSCRV